MKNRNLIAKDGLIKNFRKKKRIKRLFNNKIRIVGQFSVSIVEIMVIMLKIVLKIRK